MYSGKYSCACAVTLTKAAKRPFRKGKKIIGARPAYIKFLETETGPFATRIHEAMQKVMGHARDTLIKELGLRKALSPKDLDDIIEALNLQGFDVTVDMITDRIQEVHELASRQAVESLGLSGDDMVTQLDPRAVEFANERGAELVKELSDSTRESLRSLVEDAVREGWSVDDFTSEMADDYAFSEARATTIARTELAFAHVQGNMAGYKESGLVDRKQSMLGSEHDMDDECNDNANAGPIPFDDDFPSGDDAPPYHPNCVCDVMPILADKEQDDVEE